MLGLKLIGTVIVFFIQIVAAVLRKFLQLFHKAFPTTFKLPEAPLKQTWTNATLQPYRSIADPLADECYRILLQEHNGHFPTGFDILKEIEKRAIQEQVEKPPNAPFLKFYNETHTVPDWVDFARIERGRIWYTKVGFPGGAFVLTAASLVQSYGAAKGSKVLTETGRLNDDVVKRVFETGDFVHKILKPNGLKINGSGHEATLRVRLLHSAIRYYLLSRKKGWDSEHLGVPINQEDLMGTITLFTTVLIGGVSRLGYQFDAEEIEDYVHLWRWVGYLIGVREEALPTSWKETCYLAFAIKEHQWSPDEDSKKLVQALYNSLHLRWKYFYLPSQFWQQFSRSLMGPEYADDLGIKPTDTFWETWYLLFSALIKLQSFSHHYLPLCSWMTVTIGQFFWTVFMNIGLAGRSVDFKMKQY